MAPSQHARLGPSAADRWFACPAAPNMAAKVPPAPSSAYAAEGTRAHEVFEIALSKGALIESDCDSPEQFDALQIAFDAVTKERARFRPDHFFAVETRVRPSYRTDLHGTADVIVAGKLADTGSPCVTILDLKYGVNVIVPSTTKQLGIYALGAAGLVGMSHVEVFRAVVMQPRGRAKNIPPVRSHDYTLREMLTFNRQMLDAAAATDAPDAPAVAGKHCGWCAAKDICTAYAAHKGSGSSISDFDIFSTA